MKEINLLSFDTKNVNDFSRIFSGCVSLRKLNLSCFNTINALRMKNMFKNCKVLVQLDLSENFKTKNESITDNMFIDCILLKKINNCSDEKILKEYELIKGY